LPDWPNPAINQDDDRPVAKDGNPMISSRACLLVLLGALASCGPSGPSAAPSLPRPTGTIDGLYRGTSTRFKSEAKSCPHPGLVRFQVISQSFRYRLNGPTTLDVTVYPDGAVTGGTADFTLRGQWDGQVIEGDVVNSICALHFRAVKQK
jgi:hypothetical protein